MHAIEQTYVSLLADVAHLSEYSEVRGSFDGLQWCLNEAPKLEKYLLNCIESGESLELERFPRWLRRLAAASYSDAYKLRLCRQLLLFCYKAYVQHDKSVTESSYRAFDSCNLEVRSATEAFARTSQAVLDLARKYCQSVLYGFDGKEIVPSHGPGAVTTSKEVWQHRYSTIESLYPFSDYFCLYFNRDMCSAYEDSIPQDIIEAKLIAVPKDSRGPRLICVHPAEAIWIQQGLRRQLEKAIVRFRHHPGTWPRGHIVFDDQTINGRIALHASRSKHYATIDLKEASDRIPDHLVQYLFGRHYKWFGSCRAQKYYVPGTDFRPEDDNLYCYAPMGNATTFPVESLVFWAICCASLQHHRFHQPGAVFVFGDDIILPSSMTPFVIDDLESFGLKVNRTKSFWRGSFRESCGVDAFNGLNVTPVRWKTTFDAEHLPGLQSLSDIAMRLRIAGYEEAASTAYSILRTRLAHGYHVPLFYTNNREHGGLAELSSDANAWSDSVWNRDLQWFGTRVWHVEPVVAKRSQGSWNCCLESVVKLIDSGHGIVPDRTVSRRFRLNRGWTRVE